MNLWSQGATVVAGDWLARWHVRFAVRRRGALSFAIACQSTKHEEKEWEHFA